jgi:hypothetical protein
VLVVTIWARSFASFDSRMVAIRIDNEPELKIEDAMQVKGRGAMLVSVARLGKDNLFRSKSAA